MIASCLVLAVMTAWTFEDASLVPAPKPQPTQSVAVFKTASIEYPSVKFDAVMRALSSLPDRSSGEANPKPSTEPQVSPDVKPGAFLPKEPDTPPEPRRMATANDWVWYPQYQRWAWGHRRDDGQYQVYQWSP